MSDASIGVLPNYTQQNFNYNDQRLKQLSRQLQQNPAQKSDIESQSKNTDLNTDTNVDLNRTGNFTDEIRRLFPGLDEGKIPMSSFQLDKMPDPSTLTGEHKRLWEAAQEFQSLFINMMLKGMRSTLNPEADMLHGGRTQEIFEDMLYDERAKSYSKNAGFPLAEQIYLQMAPQITEATSSYQENLFKQVPPSVSTDQIQREWKR